MIKYITVTLTMFFILLGTVVSAATLASQKCESCHGKNGVSTKPEVPTIAGLSSAYLKDAMKDFRSSKRHGDKFRLNGRVTDMNAIARNLSRREIGILSRYYASKTFVPHKQNINYSLIAKGKKIYRKNCMRCHSDNGRDPDDDAGILGGQSKIYLISQIAKFKNGKRKGPRKMMRKLKKLKAREITAVINFFASQR
jgi:sulfide dehydrogenase cytochrome subunit